MASHRCSTCQVEWPPARKFNPCPNCDCPTWFSRMGESVTYEEADRLMKHHKFEVFYEQWDANREGPSPDVIGVEQARELIALERALEEAEEDGG